MRAFWELLLENRAPARGNGMGMDTVSEFRKEMPELRLEEGRV